METWWVKKSLFFTRIFVGLPVAFPDLNFRKVHVSQVETPQFPGLSFNPNLPSWSKHIQQDHHDASEEELHDDKDGASATFKSHHTRQVGKTHRASSQKKCSANLHPNCQAPSAKFPTHIYPHYLRCFFFSSNTIMGPYLFHMGICFWQILGHAGNPLLFEARKIPFPSGQFHEGCHTCRSWHRPPPGFSTSFQRWKHEVTADLFPIPSYSPASPIVMSIPNLRSAAMISHQGDDYSFRNPKRFHWLDEKSICYLTTSTTISPATTFALHGRVHGLPSMSDPHQ